MALPADQVRAPRPAERGFSVVVLRDARRGEAVGFRWFGADLDAGYLAVERPIL